MSTHLPLKQIDVVQTAPKRPSQKDLPTMYDLPSEDPNERCLPDEFHSYQPQLLRKTFFPSNSPSYRVLISSDLNLYYNADSYKRQNWMAVVGVSRFYQKRDLRTDYIIWQEEVLPFIVFELLSPSSQKEDLGKTLRDFKEPPSKWEVYERILGIPYYVVYSRKLDYFRAFRLVAERYEELIIPEKRLWIPEISLGLGISSGAYQDIERDWLRWYDAKGKWIATPEERIEEGIQRAEKEKQRAEQLAAQLRALGIEPNV